MSSTDGDHIFRAPFEVCRASRHHQTGYLHICRLLRSVIARTLRRHRLIGIAIAGGTMLWGGELTEFGRRACMIGLVVSVLVFAAPMLSSAFGVAAAVV
jgi:hypothetical protein